MKTVPFCLAEVWGQKWPWAISIGSKADGWWSRENSGQDSYLGGCSVWQPLRSRSGFCCVLLLLPEITSVVILAMWGQWYGEEALSTIKLDVMGPTWSYSGPEVSPPVCTHSGAWEPPNRDSSSLARSAFRKAKLSRIQSIKLCTDTGSDCTPRGCGQAPG